MNRNTLLVTIGIACLVIYSCVVGPLRNRFDDRWPYVNVFLASPGTALLNVVTVLGLGLSIRSRIKGSRCSSLLVAGFGLLICAPLLNATYSAWAQSHRTELDNLIFKNQIRLSIWKWYFWLDVPQLIAAAGLGLIVIATFKRIGEMGRETVG